MKIQKLSPQRGFSLIEVFIVLVMIGILTTLALMQLGRSRVDFQRQRISREFKIYLERARFDSVKRRADAEAERATVVLDNASQFTVMLDFDGDGVMSASERRVVNFADRTDALIRVSDVGLSYPITIAFDRKGLVTVTDGTTQPVTPVFSICSGDCAAGSTDVTRIAISTSGTVAELRAGQNPQALPTPPPTNQGAPTLNCYVLVNQSANSSCIPY